MARPSMRERRRHQIVGALVRVLAAHGRVGATVAAVASEAGVAPGLVHHHFVDKDDLYDELLDALVAGFRRRAASLGDEPGTARLDAYIDGALSMGTTADAEAARAWVTIFAEALSQPSLFAKMRRLIDGEVTHIERLSGGALGPPEASAVLAFVIGALVFGAFAPRKAAGFAAPSLHRLVATLRRSESSSRARTTLAGSGR